MMIEVNSALRNVGHSFVVNILSIILGLAGQILGYPNSSKQFCNLDNSLLKTSPFKMLKFLIFQPSTLDWLAVRAKAVMTTVRNKEYLSRHYPK